MVWGEKWKRIRIGVLLRISGAATITGDFAFGVCSGITNGAGSNSCANFIGATSRPTNTNQYTYSAGNDMATFAATHSATSSKNLTNWTDGGGLSSMKGYTAAGSAGLVINICDIRRVRWGTTSNSYVLFAQGPAGSGTGAGGPEMGADWGALLRVVGNPDMATYNLNWWYDGNASTNTMAHSETNGALDSVNIWWQHATVPLEVAGIAVFKLY
jgi:hypothetical protein